VNDASAMLSSAEQARNCVSSLNGAPTSTGILEVFSRIGVESPPCLETIQEPWDNLYVRQLPGTWTEKELQDLFSPYGTVQECRVLHRGDDARGAGALVRMSSVAEATEAILALNGQVPRSMNGEYNAQPLLVRYADTPEEKARKQARKEMQSGRQHKSLDLPKKWSHPEELQHNANLRQASLPLDLQRHAINGHLDLGMIPAPSPHDFDSLQSDFQSQLNIDALLSYIYPSASQADNMLPPPGGDRMPLGSFHDAGDPASPPKSLMHNPTLPAPQSTTYTSVYIKNCPPDTNDLWLYERFAPHGSILSVKVLHEEGTGRCRGVCFVNFTTAEGAMNAIQAMNGRKVGDKTLHVSIQARR
jgi:RNA recognition motif-containing protein